MPEIAEVETVRRTLRTQIINKKIKKVTVLYEKMVTPNAELFIKELKTKVITDILRRGKWLIFDLGQDYLFSHLRMEGKFFLKDQQMPIVKHEHVIITFTDNSELRYHDTRKFGRMLLIPKSENIIEIITRQGLEPNDQNLTSKYLYAKLRNKTLAIKSILLDQKIISGLGNIYANEVLYAAQINPWRRGKDLTLKECQRIIDASNQIIAQAIELGGTTIKSYTSSLGVTGQFQQYLQVHQREKTNCPNCGSVILRAKLNGRSTYYCPKCQKK